MANPWESVYRSGQKMDIPPHLEMKRVAELFKQSGVKRVLDLGSGGGRHTIYLAGLGFDVFGLDSSPTGLSYTLKVLNEKGLTANLTLHDMSSLPYHNMYFDAVISIQVIHHNNVDGIRKTVREIRRVLREGGLLWVTVPASKNEPSMSQAKVEPGTFIPMDGPERGLPHHYFKHKELLGLFRGFSLLDLHIDTVNHFSVLVKKVKHKLDESPAS